LLAPTEFQQISAGRELSSPQRCLDRVSTPHASRPTTLSGLKTLLSTQTQAASNKYQALVLMLAPPTLCKKMETQAIHSESTLDTGAHPRWHSMQSITELYTMASVTTAGLSTLHCLIYNTGQSPQWPL